MDKKLIQIILSSLILFIGVVLQIKIWWVNLIIFLIAYLIVSYKIIKKAIKNILKGKIFDENFLMLIASIGAFCINEYAEGVLVILLYSIGEYLQSKALKKSRDSISLLMKMKPNYANLKLENEIKKVDPLSVETGSLLIIKKGEKIPIDCIITNGETFLDTSSLTGESIPKNVKCGDEILSGSINLGEMIEVKTIKKFEDSTISKILNLIENSNQKKSNTENFITKFAKYYTPIVFALAVIVAFIPPIFLGFSNTFSTWLYRALIFLVVSCPCALVISVPLSFFGGIGCASKSGVLIKGSEYIEKLAKVDKIIFDKTGTLTKGKFKIKEVVSFGKETEEVVLRISNILESFSNHPISNAFDKTIKFDKNEVKNFKENTGYGIQAEIKDVTYYFGSDKFMKKNNIKILDDKEKIETVLYLAKEKKLIGYVLIGDELKDNIKTSIQNVKELNINDIIMLTGDKFEIANKVANEIGITKVYANQLPEDKLNNLEREMEESKSVAYVGDGINDVPVLVRSDIGISMGNIGSESAIEFSDVVIANDDISSIVTGIKISRKTMKIAKQNIIFSLCVKIIAIILSTVGMLNMWLAIFADVGVTLLAILNSLRLMKRMNNTQ